MSSISTTTSLIPASAASRATDDAQSCTPATVYPNSAGAPIISDSVLPDGHQAVPDQSGEGKLAISYSVVSINQSSLKLERQYKGLPMSWDKPPHVTANYMSVIPSDDVEDMMIGAAIETDADNGDTEEIVWEGVLELEDEWKGQE